MRAYVAWLWFASLVVVGFVDRAEAQVGPTRTHRVSFQWGSADGRGYKTAGIDVRYRFGICYGMISLQADLVPSSLSTSNHYYYKGAVREVPASSTSRQSLTVTGQAVRGGRLLGNFTLLVSADSDQGGVCFGGMTVARLSDHLDEKSRAKKSVVEAFLQSLSITTDLLPPLVDVDLEREFDREERERQLAEERERKQKEQEERERKRRADEEARRAAEQKRREAAELEAQRRREADEREARRREEERARRSNEQSDAERRSADERAREEEAARKASEQRAAEALAAAERAAEAEAERKRVAEEREREEAEARRVREQEAAERAVREREDRKRWADAYAKEIRRRKQRANDPRRADSERAAAGIAVLRRRVLGIDRLSQSATYSMTAHVDERGLEFSAGDKTHLVRWQAIEEVNVSDRGRIQLTFVTPTGDVATDMLTLSSEQHAMMVAETLREVAAEAENTRIPAPRSVRDLDALDGDRQLAAASPMAVATVQAMDEIIAMTDGGPFPTFWEASFAYEQRGGVTGGGVTVRRGGLLYVAFGLNYFEMPPVELTVTESGDEIARASDVGWYRVVAEGGFGLSIPLGRWGHIRGESLMYLGMGAVDSNPTIDDVTVDEASFPMMGLNVGLQLSLRPRSSPVGVAVFARGHTSGRWGMTEIDRTVLPDFTTRVLTMSDIGWYATFGVALVLGWTD